MVYIPDNLLREPTSKEALAQKAKILVVKEKSGPSKGRGWKVSKARLNCLGITPGVIDMRGY